MKKQLLFATSILISLHTFAQWTSDSTQNTTIRQGDSTSVYPLIATIADGKTYVSWYEIVDSTYVLKMQLMDVNGNRMWDSSGLLISDHYQDSAIYLSNMIADHDGNAIIAFQDRRLGPIAPVVYKIDQSGNFLWGPNGIQLHDTSALFEGGPTVCLLDNNDVIIAWNAEGTSKTVDYIRINADGTMPWASFKKIIQGAERFSRPAGAALDDGTFYLTYVNESSIYPFPGIVYVNHFDGNGNALWTQAVATSTYTILYYLFPLISKDVNDGLYVAFSGYDVPDTTIITSHMQHINNLGAVTWGSDGVQLADIAFTNRILSNIVYRPDSEQVVALLEILNIVEDHGGLNVQKVDANGNLIWGTGSKELLPSSVDSFRSAFDIIPAGDDLMILFSENTSPYTQNLKAMKMNSSGSILWNNALSVFNSSKYDAVIGAYIDDQAVVAWQDQRDEFGIYGQNIHGDGKLGLISSVAPVAFNPAKIYPTLTTNNLNVVLETNDSHASLEIFDIAGKAILFMPLHEKTNELYLTALPQGIYLYELRTSKGIQTGKICKQ